MHYLFLTILCSTTIALVLKHSDTKRGEPIVLLAGNYFLASLISLGLLIFNEDTSFSYQTVLFGAFLGLLFVFSFFSFAMAVSHAGTALATVSSRLSVILPITFSILLYNEIPSSFNMIGFLFTLITLILFYFSIAGQNSEGDNIHKHLYLFLTLIGIGISDFCLKIFNNWRPQSEEPLFVLTIFSFAMLYALLFIFIRRVKIERYTLLLGIGLGVPNVFSTYFLLGALSMLPAIFVYPVVNVGIIIFTAVFAYIIWKEGINRFGKWALVTGVIAIVFLSLK
ncbi:MAG: EamA family transporter [Ignavibacterium sp.]|nr:MAG: EamA family transporter [Ignavibacterium sp.]